MRKIMCELSEAVPSAPTLRPAGSRRAMRVLLLIALATLPRFCRAQDFEEHKYTVDFGGGWAPVYGNYAQGLEHGYHLRSGAGIALYRPQMEYDNNGKPVSANRWSIY